MQELYKENYKTLLTEREDDLSERTNILCTLTGTYIIKRSIFPKVP